MNLKRYATTLSIALAALTAGPVSAIVIRDGDGSGNTSATGAFADPFAHVGTRGTLGSVVYLGNGVILSANHVFSAANPTGTVNFGGTDYTLVSGSKTQLHKPGNIGIFHDLTLLKIDLTTGNPGGVLPLGTATSGSTVRYVGNGLDRATALTTYYVDVDPNPYVWTESPDGNTDATATGYKSKSTQTLRWGENIIDGTPSSSIVTVNLATDFDAVSPLTYEAQAAAHDSGGGVFQYNNVSNQWELVGITLAIGTYSGQPANTSVFGDLTYFADLSAYRDQIDAYMATVPEPCTLALLAGGSMLLLRRRNRGT